jgi:hypothetical protein
MLMIQKCVLLQKAAHTALDCVSRHITVRKAIDRFQHL